MAEKDPVQDDTKATFSTGARKKERQKTDSNDESMEKLKELEELADQTFQKIFEEYMKNKDKPPVHQPTEDELELAQKNYFGEDEGENVCESFNQPFNAMWGLGRAQVPYHRTHCGKSDLITPPPSMSSHVSATSGSEQIRSSIEKMNLNDATES